jgi:uncharacterized protein (TIGR03067 family)
MHAVLFVGLALTVPAAGQKEELKKDVPIVGEWAGVKATGAGKERPIPPGGVTFKFTADGKLIVMEGKREKADEGTYKLDTKKDPAEIDIIPPADKAERGPAKGIFKVDGDMLTICLAVEKDGERPTKFESPVGSRIMLMTFKRVTKK